MEIENELRSFEADHGPDGWPAVRMRQISTLCDKVDRLKTIEAAARKTVAAFEALGTAQHAGELLMARGNCETAMVALKAALFNAGIHRAAEGRPVE